MKYIEQIKKHGILCFFIWLCLSAFLAGCSEEEPKILMDTVTDYEEPSENPGFGKAGEAQPETEETGEAAKGADQEEKKAAIWVDIWGEVNSPGVYAMEEGDRMYQLVEKAGGFTTAAARSSVNQARILTDGEQIHVFSREEQESGELAHPQAAGSVAAGESGKINLNTAGEEELTGLSGIGPAKAAAIIAYRQEHGGFSSIEEITEVEGIGSGTFAKIKDDIVVS